VYVIRFNVRKKLAIIHYIDKGGIKQEIPLPASLGCKLATMLEFLQFGLAQISPQENLIDEDDDEDGPALGKG